MQHDIMIVHNLYLIARARFSNTSRMGWIHSLELFDIREIWGDGPSGLRLPPVIVNDDLGECSVEPPYGIRITSLTHQMEGL